MIFSKTAVLALTFFLVEGTEASLRGNVDTEERGLNAVEPNHHLFVNTALAFFYVNDETWSNNLNDISIFSNYMNTTINMAIEDFEFINNDFTVYTTGGCNEMNDVDGDHQTGLFNTIRLCAQLCLSLPDCVSFEFNKESTTDNTRCSLSNECSRHSQTVQNVDDQNLWFQRKPKIDGYTIHDTGGCKGMNELGSVSDVPLLSLCASYCDLMEKCKSFEYKKDGTVCSLSSTCERLDQTVNSKNSSNYWGVKNEITGVAVDVIYTRSLASGFGFDHQLTASAALAFFYVYDGIYDGVYDRDGFSEYLDRARTLAEKAFVTLNNNFDVYTTGGCIGHNDLKCSKATPTMELCGECCLHIDNCSSFEFNKESTSDNTRCQLSKGCEDLSQTVQESNDQNLWYKRVTRQDVATLSPSQATLSPSQAPTKSR